jgi:hypothetical protein
MMARVQRSSTLIDPTTLHAGPTAQNLNASRSPPRSPGPQQLLGRRNSLNVKPLLSFDGEELPGANSAPNVRSGHPRSVFGVDTIWERETAKLKEIEAREKIEEEELKKREDEEQRKRQKRREKRKGKSKRGNDQQTETALIDDTPRVSTEPPVLPSIPKASARRAPPVVDDDESDESMDSAEEARSLGPRSRLGAEAVAWHAGSSGEEDKGPRRTTGTGPRYPNAARPRVAEEDSEEDLPLSLAVGRAIQRTTVLTALDKSSDEELPLSILLRKAKSSLQSGSSTRSPRRKQEATDDDDEPLGLRASRAFPASRILSSSQDQDDDDRPLAYHPEQQRRTQYQMLAQHQQMMMQAQLHNSMFFGAPAMMGSGFFGQPMAAAMVMPPPPMPMPSPPPLPDAANFGRVDRWRRDVAVEGKP